MSGWTLSEIVDVLQSLSLLGLWIMVYNKADK